MRRLALPGLFSMLIGLGALSAYSCSYASPKMQELSLMQVLQSIDTHYPQVKIARLEIIKASGAFVNANGKFDPTLEASTRSQPAGGYINNYGDTQLTIPTLYNGLKLFAGYRNGQGDWPIYYQNFLTNSGGEYRAGLSLPLLRDRLIDKERTGLLSSAQLMLMKAQDAEAIKIKIYQDGIKAYWQWVEAGLQIKTFKQLLLLAKKRQDAIEKQASLGDLPELAISENLQQIIQRQQLLNQGQMIFEQASVNLSLYFRDPQGNPLVPGEQSLPALSSTSKTITGIRTSLREHPGIKKLNHYANMMRLKREQARNELLPQLDATAYTFKQNGSGGYPLLIPQAAMVGLSFKFPLLQREARGNLIQAESELRQIQTEKRFFYEQLNNEFANMLIGINRSRQQVILLKKELRLAQKVQEGETKKFYGGDSTLFLVNQREQMTTQIQLNTLHAQVQLEELKARARFFSSTHREIRTCRQK
ncbi:outer membrane component of multidrug efflux pump [Legionella birminghamensis]|uniref:Outer membrane component of multidrug efflux pump n=1 Tax=Legionella birminghamensis TaxID=28083 RepID=A0A378IGN0_9GAMM|nr:TolC family protein [Legionella birminghamensis]KTC67947.1 outer membrane component of multidrug efflux pump [Legionella birminghamensis]STX31344.1 outer membrane component of multidrug efflux pump [Legionella birminghamensis]